VKRSPMPRRTSGLARTGPPARVTPLRSRRPAAVSRDTTSGRTDHERDIVRGAVFERDGSCRLAGAAPVFGRCGGKPRTPHHLRKAGQGGPYVMSNLLTLCARHNDRIEELDRADMVAAGLVVPRTTDVASGIGQAWALLQLAGIVDWWWDGTPAHRARPDAIADTWGRP
jgi:hypothetical protein